LEGVQFVLFTHLLHNVEGQGMKRAMIGFFAELWVLFLATAALATPNFNLTGQGARALGMGGAFIAIADDATALSWNPAGLAQLDRPEVSMVFKHETQKSGFDPQNVTFLGTPLDLGPEKTNSHFVINFLSGVFPLKNKEQNLALAIAYQQQIDFFDIPDSNTTVTGGANTVSPGLAYQITPQFALGVAANIWTGLMKIDYKFHYNSSELNITMNEPYSGFNFFLGGWGSVKPMKFGAIVRTPLTLKFHDEYSGDIGIYRLPLTGEYKLKFPFMIGFGAAVEPTQNLTIAADLDIRPYSNMEFLDSADVEDPSKTEHTQDITQFRLGAEYLLMLGPGIVPLRAGFRTDPRTYTGVRVEPDTTTHPGYLRPKYISDDKQISGTVFSFGTGFAREKFQLDGVFEFGSTKRPIEWDPYWQANPSIWEWRESSMRFLVSGIVRF